MSHRPRRVSYRRRLAAAFLLRYVACLMLATPVLLIASAARSPLLILAFALFVYPACGLYLRGFLSPRVIWLSIEPARRIGEAQRAMLLLWPVQGARFLRLLGNEISPGPSG